MRVQLYVNLLRKKLSSLICYLAPSLHEKQAYSGFIIL